MLPTATTPVSPSAPAAGAGKIMSWQISTEFTPELWCVLESDLLKYLQCTAYRKTSDRRPCSLLEYGSRNPGV